MSNELKKVSPKLEQKVYLKIGTQIIEDKAKFLGMDGFVINFNYSTRNEYLFWDYKDYGRTWFLTLKEAKESFGEIPNDEHFVKYDCRSGVYWELEFK